MKRRDFIKRSGLSALTAWAGSSVLLSACHTEEDMIGEPNWIVEGVFDRPLVRPGAVGSGVTLNAQFGTSELLKGRSSATLAYGNGVLGPTIPGSQRRNGADQSPKQSGGRHKHPLAWPDPAGKYGRPEIKSLPLKKDGKILSSSCRGKRYK
jgi:hypothetical protein